MSKVIISYRRSDSAAIAGRIRDRLVARYGEDSIFMDIENIPFGSDFRTHIRDTLLQSDVLISIVGPKWLGRAKGGGGRMAAETDPVRIEIETALQGRIPLIPVLVNGARMPDAGDIPESLKDFAFLNAAEVDTGRDFHQHMDRLIQAIDGIIIKKSGSVPEQPGAARTGNAAQTVDPRKNVSLVPIMAAAAVLLIAGAFGAFWLTKAPSSPSPLRTAAQPVNQPAPAPSTVAVNAPAKPVSTTSAPRCDESAAAFVDDFQSAKAGWIHLGETRIGSNAYYDNGQMVLIAATQNTKWIVVPSRHFADATICADLKSPAQADDLNATAGGLVFWSRIGNMDDIYTANLYPDGSYAILRKDSGKWSTIVPKKAFAGIHKGLGAQNQIKVALKSSTATLYINGVKAQEIEGDPPDGGGVIGLFARSERNAQNQWRFLRIAVAQER
ncbi:MAG TPA: toll/interleukin-1 receptor domain-containing protein [Pseudolabrys sp.]|nr:toll/interleukin-1 receptor domain-containing protein [Pseudolabrys sp.]